MHARRTFGTNCRVCRRRRRRYPEAKNFFAPELEKTGIESLFFDIEMPLIYVLAEMEQTGVKLDTVALKQSSDELTDALKNWKRNL